MMATDATGQRCPHCHQPIDPGTITCPHCGQLLSTETDKTEAPLPTPAVTVPLPFNTTEEAIPAVEGSDAAEDTTLSEPATDAADDKLLPAPVATIADPADSASAPPPANQKAPQRGNRRLKLVLVCAAVLIILSATSAGILYAVTRSQPLITITSDYHVGNVPAGSTSTTLHITGKQFSGNSGVSFLLDGHPAPGSQVVPSDENGAIEADLPITAQWKIGTHQITARDINGYTTHASVKVMVVHQGEAHTPGPNGAPANDTPLFTFFVTIISQQAISLLSLTGARTVVLTVQGRPDPAGGSVCDLQRDDGKSHTQSTTLDTGTIDIPIAGSTNALIFLEKETTAYTCSGTYQNAKISFTEMNTVDDEVYSNKVTCGLTAPRISYQLQGAFNSATTASGTYNAPASTLKCSDGSPKNTPAATGTWTAIVAM